MNRRPRMIAVGYWAEPPGRRAFDLPHPADLADPTWGAGTRPRVCEYLRAGHTWARWRGTSYCRIGRCGVGSNGSRDLTDGVYVWPEGLAHYVERHDVVLPEPFVDHARANDWQVPAWAPPAEPWDKHLTDEEFTFWLGWAEAQLRSDRGPPRRGVRE